MNTIKEGHGQSGYVHVGDGECTGAQVLRVNVLRVCVARVVRASARRASVQVATRHRRSPTDIGPSDVAVPHARQRDKPWRTTRAGGTHQAMSICTLPPAGKSRGAPSGGLARTSGPRNHHESWSVHPGPSGTTGFPSSKDVQSVKSTEKASTTEETHRSSRRIGSHCSIKNAVRIIEASTLWCLGGLTDRHRTCRAEVSAEQGSEGGRQGSVHGGRPDAHVGRGERGQEERGESSSASHVDEVGAAARERDGQTRRKKVKEKKKEEKEDRIERQFVCIFSRSGVCVCVSTEELNG